MEKAYEIRIDKECALKSLILALDGNNSCDETYLKRIKEYNLSRVEIDYIPLVESSFRLAFIEWQSYEYYCYRDGYVGHISGDSVSVSASYDDGYEYKTHTTDERDFDDLGKFDCKPWIVKSNVFEKYNRLNIPKTAVSETAAMLKRKEEAIEKSRNFARGSNGGKDSAYAYLKTKGYAEKLIRNLNDIKETKYIGTRTDIKDYKLSFTDTVVYLPVFVFSIDGHACLIDAVLGKAYELHFQRNKDYTEKENILKKKGKRAATRASLVSFVCYIFCLFIMLDAAALMFTSEAGAGLILLYAILLFIAFCATSVNCWRFINVKGKRTVDEKFRKLTELDKDTESVYNTLMKGFSRKAAIGDTLISLSSIAIALLYAVLVAATRKCGSFYSFFTNIFTLHTPIWNWIWKL